MKIINRKIQVYSFFFLHLFIASFSQTSTPPKFHDAKGNIEITKAGQLQYTLNIDTPPGVKDLTPNISLIYTSGGQNGLAGLNWNLSGMSSISRVGRTLDKDGIKKSAQLDYSDYYSFNGQRLVLKSGEYGKDGATYATENYSNTKIKSVGPAAGISGASGPEYWEVSYPDGSQAWYGATAPGYNAAKTSIDYNLVKLKDQNGNYISYTYSFLFNTSIISKIEWGGNEILNKSHFNKIEFIYSEMQIPEEAYINGSSLTQTRYLNKILVSSNGAQYKKYVLSHVEDGSQSLYKHLEKISVLNSQNQESNPIEFAFDISGYNSELPNIYDIGGNKSATLKPNKDTDVVGDFDGDGNLDLLRYHSVTMPNVPTPGLYLYTNFYRPDYFTKLGNKPTFINSTLQELKDFIPVNFKKANLIYNRQGIVGFKKINNTSTSKKDLQLSFYSISTGNSLTLDYVKTIPDIEKYNQGEATDEFEDFEPFGNKTFTILGLETHDFNGDGLNELLLRLNFRYCTQGSGGPGNPTTQSENITPGTQCNDFKKFIAIDLDENLQNNSWFYPFEFNDNNYASYRNGDFNGDGLSDFLRIDENKRPLLITVQKTTQGKYEPLTSFFGFANTALNGDWNNSYSGDFNGDGLSDIMMPVSSTSDMWTVYTSTGTGFTFDTKKFVAPYPNRSINHSGDGRNITIYNPRRFVAFDYNNDGKAELVAVEVQKDYIMKMEESSENAVKYAKKFFINTDVFSTTSGLYRLTEFGGYLPDVTVNENTISAELAVKPDDLMLTSAYQYKGVMALMVSSIVSFNHLFGDAQHIRLSQYRDISRVGRITRISEGGKTTEITYQRLDKTTNPGFYDAIKTENYPYVEISQSTGIYVVAQLQQSTMSGKKLIQDFRYRGLTSHILGKGMIGFRQQARSSWYADGLENTKIWSGVEIDPVNEGVPVKEWSIRTNNESKIFPADLSIGNNELLSFKSTAYSIKKLLSDQEITGPIADIDKPKVVTVILPETTKAKDFLTGSVAESTFTYGDYYLPAQTIAKINTSYAVTTSNYIYDHNPSGAGVDYYIGRLKSTTKVTQAYGDSKSEKEEFTYENNCIKTVKRWNQDNTGYILDTFTYGDFGNAVKKVTANSIDSNTETTESLYDPKGRFIITKKDNAGLETQIQYSDSGQILTQSNPLGVTVTNIYDAWGKLISSESNLEGTTTYTYDRDTNYNALVTENQPDGNVVKTYTNKLGQKYKVSTKAFGQGQFICIETQYDILGRKIKESEPYFEGQSATKWNTIAYDDSVYPAKIKALAFTGKETETGIAGFITTTRETTGYERITTKTADALGNMVSTTDLGGSVQFSYNAAGQQIQATYAENTVTTKYDSWGRKSEFTDPSNGTYQYEYDGFGRAKKTISPKGTKEYTYNEIGQLVSQREISTVDGGQATNKTISFTYNNKKLLASKSGTISGQTFSFSYAYDTYGRLLSSTENSNGKTYAEKAIIYDNKGRVASYEKELNSSGITTKAAVENIYSPWNGELYQIKDKVSGKILWELKETDAKGMVLRAKLGAADITNSYDNNGFLKAVNHSSAVKPNIMKLTYTFDALRNELKNRKTEGDFSIEEKFFYDNNNRLINWTDPVTGPVIGLEPASRNVYDIKGRIIQNDQVGTIKFENTAKIYQPTGMTLSAAGVQNYNDDLIQTVTYNENNDPVLISGEKNRVHFDYGLGSMRQRVDITKLKETAGGGGGSSEFSTMSSTGIWDPNAPVWEDTVTKFYNEDNSFEIVRNRATNQEKHILYIAGTPYESNIVYLKDYGQTTGSYKYLHKDYLGSILAITDEAGNKLEGRHYDAWGNFTHLKIGNSLVITDKAIIAVTGTLIDRGYTSHEHFIQVGIIHMNGRLYDPLLRRFLNADENIQDPTNTQNYNKYGYVMNNPMMYSDPNGEFWWMVVGALVGGYLNGVQANNGNWNPGKWDWGNSWSAVLGGAIGGASISGALGNITSNPGAIKNILSSAVSGGLNSAFNGSNFLSGAVSGMSYSSNLFDNRITSIDISSVSTSRKNIDHNENNSLLDILYYDIIFRTDGSSLLEEQLKKNYKLDGAPDFSEDGMKRMISVTPELTRLYKLGNSTAKFKAVTFIPGARADVSSITAGETFGNLVYVSKTAITNNFIMGVVLGHEMIHVYHNRSFRDQWMREYSDTSGRRSGFISEVEAHTWSKLMGDPSAPINISYYQNLLLNFKINYKPKNIF